MILGSFGNFNKQMVMVAATDFRPLYQNSQSSRLKSKSLFNWVYPYPISEFCWTPPGNQEDPKRRFIRFSVLPPSLPTNPTEAPLQGCPIASMVMIIELKSRGRARDREWILCTYNISDDCDSKGKRHWE